MEDLLLEFPFASFELFRAEFADFLDLHDLDGGCPVTGEELCTNRELIRRQTERFTSEGLRDPIELEQDVARTNRGNPILGGAFTFTHSGFRWAGSYGLVWKNTNPELALTLHVAGKGNAGGFDL